MANDVGWRCRTIFFFYSSITNCGYGDRGRNWNRTQDCRLSWIKRIHLLITFSPWNKRGGKTEEKKKRGSMDLWLSFVRKMEESSGGKWRVERGPVRGVNVAEWPAAGRRHEDLREQRSHWSRLASLTKPAKQHCKTTARTEQLRSNRERQQSFQNQSKNHGNNIAANSLPW